MAKSKSEIIEDLKSIKNVPIATLKEKPLENSSGSKHIALSQYNAMLDNITIGCHTTTIIEFAGVEWRLRLIGSEERSDINLECLEVMKSKQVFDKWYSDYLEIIKTLAKALSPSPFKTEGKAIFSEDDLKLIPFDVLAELFKRYIHFCELATKKVDDFTEEEVQLLIETVGKKPEALTEFGRSPLLIVSRYYLDYSARLEKMLKSEQTN